MADPSKHEAHELPIINRLIEVEVRAWLDTGLSIAAASFGGDTAEYEHAGREAIEQVRYLHLAGADHTLVPRIIDALRRAGLLAEVTPAEQVAEVVHLTPRWGAKGAMSCCGRTPFEVPHDMLAMSLELVTCTGAAEPLAEADRG